MLCKKRQSRRAEQPRSRSAGSKRCAHYNGKRTEICVRQFPQPLGRTSIKSDPHKIRPGVSPVFQNWAHSHSVICLFSAHMGTSLEGNWSELWGLNDRIQLFLGLLPGCPLTIACTVFLFGCELLCNHCWKWRGASRATLRRETPSVEMPN